MTLAANTHWVSTRSFVVQLGQKRGQRQGHPQDSDRDIDGNGDSEFGAQTGSGTIWCPRHGRFITAAKRQAPETVSKTSSRVKAHTLTVQCCADMRQWSGISIFLVKEYVRHGLVTVDIGGRSVSSDSMEMGKAERWSEKPE